MQSIEKQRLLAASGSELLEQTMSNEKKNIMRNSTQHDRATANAGCDEMRAELKERSQHASVFFNADEYFGKDLKINVVANKDYPPQIGGNHYDKYQIKPIAALKDWLSEEEYRGYLRGNAIKYQIRYRDKGGAEDLRKAQWYLNELLKLEETQ